MMLKGEVLDILFRRIAPEKLLQHVGKTQFCPSKKELYGWFMGVSETTLHGYSGDEKDLIFQGAFAAAGNPLTQEETCPPPFHLLVQYGNEVLERRAGKMRCKFDLTLDWREVYLKLGQDLIVTAWLAYHAVSDPVRDPDWVPDSFSWPAIIPTNNLVLERILEKDGLSENHYHLYGSAAVFALNWSRLMTWPRLDESIPWFEERLQFRTGRGQKDNQNSLKKNLLTAALLRACLFRITKEAGSCVDCLEELEKFAVFTNEEGDGPGRVNLLREIDVLRFQYALPFEQPDGSGFRCLDYAFTQELQEESESDSRILAGERKLLFECFKAYFSGKWDRETQWCFYLYLLLKSDFRQEMIQINQEIGFRNFQDYERRKFSLWNVSEVGDAYWNEACRTAVAAPLREQPIQALELRLTPKETADENFRMIYDIDRAMAFYLGRCGNGWDDLRKFPAPDKIDWNYDLKLKQLQDMERFFFVLHFVKQKDLDEMKKHKVPFFACRHRELRNECRKRARALMEALSAHPYLTRRIRGIDACSNEIGCRPEIFATSFRFLRACPVWLFRKPKFFPGELICPTLSVTYHAGEDFLDIVDGLRAIDEAVLFLNLRRGDRIGHALALGISPKIHYETKHDCVTLSKQDLLDNLIWLRFRSEELNLVMPSTLRERIRNLSEDLFSELYRDRLNEAVTIRDYYRSWKLRGDDPALYKPAGEHGCITEPKSFDEFRFCYRTPPPNRADRLEEDELESCRNQQHSPAVKLYFLYQFDYEVKTRGRKSICFPVQPDYVRLVEEMQNKMRLYIDSLGLCVECNPSSNVLIGTFDFYRQHPIFLFHRPGPYERSASQLHVSLNTDDQGIFDTSLSFEYAVVAAALMAEKTSEGERRYTNREIEDYLRDLQRMGNEQSFQRSQNYGRSF